MDPLPPKLGAKHIHQFTDVFKLFRSLEHIEGAVDAFRGDGSGGAGRSGLKSRSKNTGLWLPSALPLCSPLVTVIGRYTQFTQSIRKPIQHQVPLASHRLGCLVHPNRASDSKSSALRQILLGQHVYPSEGRLEEKR